MQTVVHRSDDAEVSAAATQRPKQLLFAVGLGDNETPIRENDLGGDEIVERKPEAADQRSVTAAQGESRHADATVRACYRRNAQRIRHGGHVRGAGASRNSRAMVIGADGHAVHAAQIDNESGAQGATGPVVASAAHRQWKIAIACGSKRRLNIFGGPAVGDSARHAADGLRPDRCCGGVAVIARQR